jgi:hypothetical protein
MVEASTNMIHRDPIALRVARRHVREAAVVLLRCPQERSYRIDFTDSGRISDVALARDENANVVAGKLVPHAAVAPDEVVSWAEVTVDHRVSFEHIDLPSSAASLRAASSSRPVRHAADADPRLVVVADGCSDPDPDVHRVLAEKVFPRQATVTTAEG